MYCEIGLSGSRLALACFAAGNNRRQTSKMRVANHRDRAAYTPKEVVVSFSPREFVPLRLNVAS
jgi:hypothetical protein